MKDFERKIISPKITVERIKPFRIDRLLITGFDIVDINSNVRVRVLDNRGTKDDPYNTVASDLGPNVAGAIFFHLANQNLEQPGDIHFIINGITLRANPKLTPPIQIEGISGGTTEFALKLQRMILTQIGYK